jgi:acid ceramidase
MAIVYDIPVVGHEDGAAMLEWVDREFGPLLERMPQPYQDEIAGLADAANIDVGQLVLINIFYEVFTVCTSIVAQDSQGNVYHGRNLDFGLFPAYNLTDHDWTMTDLLRPLMVNVEFTQNGGTLFRSVQ